MVPLKGHDGYSCERGAVAVVTVARGGPGRFQAGPRVRLRYICRHGQRRCCQADQRTEEHGPDAAAEPAEPAEPAGAAGGRLSLPRPDRPFKGVGRDSGQLQLVSKCQLQLLIDSPLDSSALPGLVCVTEQRSADRAEFRNVSSHTFVNCND